MDMRINTLINHYTYNSNNVFRRITFKSNSEKNSSDVFFKNEPERLFVKKDERNNLKGITFSKPESISSALLKLADTKDEYIQSELFCKSLHSPEEFTKMSIDLKNIKELENIKIKSLHGIGAFALAFETTDGLILKVCEYNHFKNNRKPAFFDLPIIKKGKSGYTYYYLEEKVSQDNISEQEIRVLIKEIKKRGYTLRDYLLKFSFANNENAAIKKEQFGRAKNGKIYLIDPGCAIEPHKDFFDIKRIKDAKETFIRFIKRKK